MNNNWNDTKRELCNYLMEKYYRIIKDILEEKKGEIIEVRSKRENKTYKGNLINYQYFSKHSNLPMIVKN